MIIMMETGSNEPQKQLALDPESMDGCVCVCLLLTLSTDSTGLEFGDDDLESGVNPVCKIAYRIGCGGCYICVRLHIKFEGALSTQMAEQKHTGAMQEPKSGLGVARRTKTEPKNL